MNDTIRSILEILEADRPPELKIAAAQVLGELAPKEPGVVKVLEARLRNGEEFLARHVLAALAAIGSTASMRVLVAGLDGKLADLAAHLLRELGERTAPVLAVAFEPASLETRTRILGILGHAGGPKVVPVAEAAIVVPELSRRAGEVLAASIDALDGRQRRPLKTRLTKLLAGEDLAPQCAAAILQVLATIDPAGSRATLIKHADADHPAMVRKSALDALRPIKLTPTQAGTLLQLLGEDDDVHVVEPALEILEHVEKWPADAVPVLRKLMSARKPRLRPFAVKALGSVPLPELVKPFIQLLHGDDPQLADAAAVGLGANPHASETLLRSFLQEKDLDRARRTMLPLLRLGREFGAKEIKGLLERGSKLLLAHDPMGELVLTLLVDAKPLKGSAAIVDKAIRLRRQKKFAESIGLLAFVAATRHIDIEGRYQLALSRLLFDASQTRHADDESAAGDATMGYFALLVREGFPVLDRLKRESMVAPEDLLRVGQHFTDAVGDERRFGAELLHHVAAKHARRRAGEEARMTLRAEGL